MAGWDVTRGGGGGEGRENAWSQCEVSSRSHSSLALPPSPQPKEDLPDQLSSSLLTRSHLKPIDRRFVSAVRPDDSAVTPVLYRLLYLQDETGRAWRRGGVCA
jgi:hypothetical protein